MTGFLWGEAAHCVTLLRDGGLWARRISAKAKGLRTLLDHVGDDSDRDIDIDQKFENKEFGQAKCQCKTGTPRSLTSYIRRLRTF